VNALPEQEVVVPSIAMNQKLKIRLASQNLQDFGADILLKGCHSDGQIFGAKLTNEEDGSVERLLNHVQRSRVAVLFKEYFLEQNGFFTG
jgi:hypothetical protein